jgi:4'-phosphopantetheinyl transferase
MTKIFLFQKDQDFSPEYALQKALHLFDPDFNFHTVKLEHQKNGQPYLKGIPYTISISHSGIFWGCALCDCDKIGFDIQIIEQNREMNSIAKRFFHPAEYAHLCRTQFSDFFSIWTAKESYVKYLGSGIDENFCRFSTVNQNGFLSAINGTALYPIKWDSAYRIFCCGGKSTPLFYNFAQKKGC